MNLRELKASVLYYPTLGWNVLLGRILKTRNWWDPIDDNVILGAIPFPDDVPRLHQLGVRGIVNTCAEWSGYPQLYSKLGIRQFHMPTTDFTSPSLQSLIDGVNFIGDFARSGQQVYVHCKAGRSRSGIVVMAWLIHHHGLDVQQSQARLLEHRPHANPRLVQYPVIHKFHDWHLQNAGQPGTRNQSGRASS